jgi:hypothetical protein
VHAGGLDRDEQLRRDLPVAEPRRDQAQYLQLAWGKPERRAPGRGAVGGQLDACAARELVDLLQQRLGVELAASFAACCNRLVAAAWSPAVAATWWEPCGGSRT